MRKIGISVVFLVALAAPLWAQIPNPSFETWSGTGTSIIPAGWYANDIFVPGYPVPITRSTTAHSGTYSCQAAVVNFAGYAYPPLLQANFPYKQRPAALSGYYQFTSVGSDSLMILTELYTQSTGTYHAAGFFTAHTNAGAWTKFSVPLQYVDAVVPDSAWIYIVVGGGQDSAHVGSTALIDDLTFEGVAAGVAEQPQKPAIFALHQNYPNPFNPTTTITYEIAKSSIVKLSVFDLLGREVATLVNERRDPGAYKVSFDGSALPSGIYFYRLEAGSFVQTRRLALVK